jgi:hypothetical protein
MANHSFFVVWNNHARIPKDTAEIYIREWLKLTPASPVTSSYAPAEVVSSDAKPDLDMPEELAVRSLLLGLAHRTAGAFKPARQYLEEAHQLNTKLDPSSWIGAIPMFELAVLDLQEASANLEDPSGVVDVAAWAKALASATQKLDKATSLNGAIVDLSSRLEMRMSMLRDEITSKREMVGIPAA